MAARSPDPWDEKLVLDKAQPELQDPGVLEFILSFFTPDGVRSRMGTDSVEASQGPSPRHKSKPEAACTSRKHRPRRPDPHSPQPPDCASACSPDPGNRAHWPYEAIPTSQPSLPGF